MATFLGLLGLIVFVASIIGLAAAVTWVVVKVIPADRGQRKEETT